MKLLYIGDLDLRGGGAMWRLYHTLPYISRRFETVVLCAGHVSAEFMPLFDKNGIKLVFAKNISPESLMDTFLSEKADLVVVPWEYPAYLVSAYLASKNLGVPYAALIHGLPIIGTPLKTLHHYRFHAFLKVLGEFKQNMEHTVNRSVGSKLRLFAKKLMSIDPIYRAMRGGFILAVGPVSELYLRSYFGDHERIFTIVPGNGFEPPPINASGSSFVYDACFMAARLSREKGLFDFLEVVAMVSRRRRMRAAVMGRFAGANDESSFYSTCRKLGIAGSIEHLGFLSGPEKFKVLGSSKIFIYPSVADSFSLSLLEALGCGCPSVVWNLPYTLQFECEALFKVPYGNYGAYAQRVLGLLDTFENHQEEYCRLRKSAAGFAKQFSWENVARAEISIYEKIGALLGKDP